MPCTATGMREPVLAVEGGRGLSWGGNGRRHGSHRIRADSGGSNSDGNVAPARLERIGRTLGLANLYAKVEGQNPTNGHTHGRQYVVPLSGAARVQRRLEFERQFVPILFSILAVREPIVVDQVVSANRVAQ